MKVLHLWDSYAPGLFDHSFEICREEGVEARLACMHFVDRGHAVPPEIAYVRLVRGEDEAHDLAARVWRRRRTALDEQQFRRLARKIVREFDPDLIHFHYGTTAAILEGVEEVVGRPCIVSFYGFDISQGLESPRLRAAYRRLMLRRPFVHVLCDEAARRANSLGADPERIVKANLPLPVDRYPYVGVSEGGDFRWLIPARFVEKKGHRIALEAFRRHVADHPQSRLSCWGYGPSGWLRKLVEEMGLSDEVEIVDNVSEGSFDDAYLRQLERHDAILAPSVRSQRGDDEGGPALTAVLAQVAGKPVIVSDFPGHERSVSDGVEGLVVPQGDAVRLASAMDALASDRERARAMGKAGRDRGCREFDRATYRDALFGWYRQLAESRSTESEATDTSRRTAGSSMVLGGALSLGRLVSGLVRIKVVALALGVGGVGIFSLLQQVNLTGLSMVSMSLAIPIINLGRPRVKAGTPEQAGRIAGTALAILAVNALILLLAAAISGNYLLIRVGAGEVDPDLIWTVVAAILFGAVASSFWEGMSYLSDRFDVYVKAGIVSAMVDMLFSATAAWFFGLQGAILVMPAGPIALFGSYVFLLTRDPTARSVLRNLSVNLRELPAILTFSAMMFAGVALTNIGLTVVRARVLIDSGPAANGYLQTVTSLAAYMLAFVTQGFWGHMHARAAAEGDTPEVRAELRQAVRLGLLISFTGCGTAAVLASFLIRLFFARQFSAAAPLMIAYMPGELCFQLLYLLTSYQLTISRRRRYLGWNLGYIGLLVVIGMTLIPRYGAAGYVAAHVASAGTVLAIAGSVCWRSGQVNGPLLALIAALVALLGVMAATLIFLHSSGGPAALELLGLVPVGVTGLLAARELLAGFRRSRAAA